MIQYVKVAGETGKKPVATRVNDTGKTEYCFGRNIWRKSVKLAWRDYQDSMDAIE